MSSDHQSQHGFYNLEQRAKEEKEAKEAEQRAKWAREDQLRKERDARLRQFLTRTGYDKLIQSMVADFAAVQGWDPSGLEVHWYWFERNDESGVPNLSLYVNITVPLDASGDGAASGTRR